MNKRGRRKILEGIVVSDKMNKTIVVQVDRFFFHPLYKKRVKKRKKYKVDDPKEKAKVGDRVKIIETRPLSKEKYFRLLEVIK